MKTAFIFCLSLVLSIISMRSLAVNYYVDPSSTLSTHNGNLGTPFTALSQLPALNAGDSVFLRTAQTFPGNLIINRSGVAGNPIFFGSYGSGSFPTLVYASGNVNAIRLSNANYIVIDGLKITDPTLAADLGHNTVSNITSGIEIDNSTNCIVRNCDISLVGDGVSLGVGSNFTTITNNHIYNLRMVINTPRNVNANDDRGAQGIGVESSNNTFTYNKMENAWGVSYDYGFDGGAFEFYGTTNSNVIMYNTCSYCSGFLEIGSGGSGTSNNNVVAYNKITNCGAIGDFHSAGAGFAASVTNLQYYNNDVVVTANPYTNSLQLFGGNGTANNGMLVLKNNIFWVTTNMNFTDNSFNPSQISHTNNIYHLNGGSLNIILGSTEKQVTVIPWVATTGDPSTWNFSLLPNSLPILFGVNVGITKDFVSTPVTGIPDAGILQFNLNVPPPPPISLDTLKLTPNHSYYIIIK